VTQWSPLLQEPEAPLHNATSRNCLLAHLHARVSAFHPGGSRGMPRRGIAMIKELIRGFTLHLAFRTLNFEL
jgi:hypothetical protein